MRDELRIALDKIDRLMFHAVCESHKRLARKHLRGIEPVTSAYAERVLDRFWRREAANHPMGYFIHGSTFEEPRRGS